MLTRNSCPSMNDSHFEGSWFPIILVENLMIHWTKNEDTTSLDSCQNVNANIGNQNKW